MTGAEIDLVANPRKEASHNDLLVANDQLLELGLDPVTLEDDLLSEVTEIAQRYVDRCDRSRIPCTSLWVSPARDERRPRPRRGREAQRLADHRFAPAGWTKRSKARRAAARAREVASGGTRRRGGRGDGLVISA